MRLVLQVILALLLAPLALAQPPQGTGPPVVQLIEQLGSQSFQEREAATRALEARGVPALVALHEAVTSADPEVRRRTKRLVDSIQARFNADEFAKLRGKWRVIPMAADGRKVEEKLHLIFTFQEGGMHIANRPIDPQAKALLGRQKNTYSVTLRWDRSANQIDLAQVAVGSDVRQQLLKGIYKVEGDRLWLCLARSGNERPEGFDFWAQPKLLTWVLEKED